MGCGGTKTEMNKKEIIEWVKKEKQKFSDELEKEEKREGDKLYQTLQKGENKGEDPLADKLKAIGEMNKVLVEYLDQKNYLEQFAEFELTLERSEYNNLNVCQEIFSDFLKLKQNREFKNTSPVLERFRKYVMENDKNQTYKSPLQQQPQIPKEQHQHEGNMASENQNLVKAN